MMIKTKLKHICRLHAEMIALMTEVRKDTEVADWKYCRCCGTRLEEA